jgi:hypothetical protein
VASLVRLHKCQHKHQHKHQHSSHHKNPIPLPMLLPMAQKQVSAYPRKFRLLAQDNLRPLSRNRCTRRLAPQDSILMRLPLSPTEPRSHQQQQRQEQE